MFFFRAWLPEVTFDAAARPFFVQLSLCVRIVRIGITIQMLAKSPEALPWNFSWEMLSFHGNLRLIPVHGQLRSKRVAVALESTGSLNLKAPGKLSQMPMTKAHIQATHDLRLEVQRASKEGLGLWFYGGYRVSMAPSYYRFYQAVSTALRKKGF